jgi:glycosyltransferase involved in cell wall biosynthesis
MNLIKKIFYKISKILMKLMLKTGFTWPLVMVYAKAVEKASGDLTGSGDSEKKYTLLALNPIRFFKGDLERLADEGGFRILKLPFNWMGRMLRLVWNDDFNFDDYFTMEDEAHLRERKKLNSYLKTLIKPLFKKLKVDGVISVAVYYKQDYEWGKAAQELGYQYIVLHKESLVGSVATRKNQYERFKKMEKFPGSQLIVYNQDMKDIFINSGYATEDQVSILGCIRMDNYINRLKSIDESTPKRKQVLLFSFHYCADASVDLYFERTFGYINFFENVHVSIGELAQKHPDIDFLIKTKWGGEWYDEVDYVFEKNGLSRKDLPNLKVTCDVNVHDAILDSTVVCTYGSTTILEAAIAGKPVVIPFFDEPLEQNPDLITLREYFDEFDLADSKEKFKSLIEERLENPEIPAEKLAHFRDVFSEKVSPWEGNALEKYTEKIKELIGKK